MGAASPIPLPAEAVTLDQLLVTLLGVSAAVPLVRWRWDVHVERRHPYHRGGG
jgi:hypothetical protein